MTVISQACADTECDLKRNFLLVLALVRARFYRNIMFELSKIEKVIRDESQKDESGANNKTVSSAPEGLHNNYLSKLIFAVSRYVVPNALQMFIPHF